jgi:hypothetical protein
MASHLQDSRGGFRKCDTERNRPGVHDAARVIGLPERAFTAALTALQLAGQSRAGLDEARRTVTPASGCPPKLCDLPVAWLLVIQVARDQIARTLRATVGSSAATRRAW